MATKFNVLTMSLLSIRTMIITNQTMTVTMMTMNPTAKMTIIILIITLRRVIMIMKPMSLLSIGKINMNIHSIIGVVPELVDKKKTLTSKGNNENDPQPKTKKSTIDSIQLI